MNLVWLGMLRAAILIDCKFLSAKQFRRLYIVSIYAKMADSTIHINQIDGSDPSVQ